MAKYHSLRAIFIGVACVSSFVLAATLAGAFYLFGVKHYRYAAMQPMFRFAFVRGYLFDPKFRRFLELVAAEDATGAETFRIAWDAEHGELLSRKVFQPVEMDGVMRYMYKPGLRLLQVVAGADGVYRELVVEDTPAVRRALADLDVRSFGTASYDGRGFRQADPDLTRDCDLHVLFVGDSFTDGIGVSDSDTFVNRFGHLVRERSKLAVCPINSGVEGYGSEEQAWVLEHRFAEAGRPGVVVVMHYPNDVDSDIDALVAGTLPGRDQKWTRNLALLARMAAFCRSQGATMVLAAIPASIQTTKPETRRHYQDPLRAWAEASGVAFVDMLDGFVQAAGRDLYFKSDLHFSPAGHRLAAEILYARTNGLLVNHRDVAERAQ